MQTIIVAERRAGVHHFDCWKKKLEQMKTRRTPGVDKKKNHFPKHCKSQARKQMTLRVLTRYIETRSLCYMGIKNQNFTVEEIPKWFVRA